MLRIVVVLLLLMHGSAYAVCPSSKLNARAINQELRLLLSVSKSMRDSAKASKVDRQTSSSVNGAVMSLIASSNHLIELVNLRGEMKDPSDRAEVDSLVVSNTASLVDDIDYDIGFISENIGFLESAGVSALAAQIPPRLSAIRSILSTCK